MSRKTIIMGIDPGLASAGWGVIEAGSDGSRLLEYGCIKTPRGPAAPRLEKIYGGISELAARFSPAEASVEELFFAKNTKSAMDVAQARGAIILALRHSGIRVEGYTPLEIKQALVGYGRASKQQVQYMVRQFLGVKEIPRPEHAADALAAALCHAGSRKLKSALSGSSRD